MSKKVVCEKDKVDNQTECKKNAKLDEKTLEQMAVDEIYKEIAIKSVRVNEVGPSGWLDCPLKKTNKRFLGKTLRAAVSHNERRKDKEKFLSEKRLLELDYEKHPTRRPKFGDRKILFKKPNTTNKEKK